MLFPLMLRHLPCRSARAAQAVWLPESLVAFSQQRGCICSLAAAASHATDGDLLFRCPPVEVLRCRLDCPARMELCCIGQQLQCLLLRRMLKRSQPSHFQHHNVQHIRDSIRIRGEGHFELGRMEVRGLQGCGVYVQGSGFMFRVQGSHRVQGSGCVAAPAAPLRLRFAGKSTA